MENQIFSTRDLVLSATLTVLRFPLLSVDLEVEGIKEKAIGYFKFEETPELKEARMEYNRGNIRVEPRSLANTIQSLKSQVVNASRELSIRSA